MTFVGLMKIFRPKIEIFKMIFVQIEILGKEEQLKAREQELGEVGCDDDDGDDDGGGDDGGGDDNDGILGFPQS